MQRIIETPEDTSVLRHHPLGIHSLDGADIVIGKAPRHANTAVVSDEPILMKAMQAKSDYYGPLTDDSVPTDELEDDIPLDGLTDLSICSGQHQKTQYPTTTNIAGVSLNSNLSGNLNGTGFSGVDIDFGNDFSTELSKDFTSSLGKTLDRQNTITARAMPKTASAPSGLADLKTSSGPSSNPLLIQRMRSIRKQLSRNTDPANDYGDYEDDVIRAKGLPEDLIEMIAFSPDSPWLENDLSDNDDIAEEAEVHRQRQQQQQVSKQESFKSFQPAEWNKTPVELNPFSSINVNKRMLENLSPSVSTLASSVSPNESLKDVNEADIYGAPSSAKHVEMPPSIEEIDPVSEDDRGRLFLQINKFANMKGLPIDVPRNPKFTLSLDNGLQTVTTEPLPLPSPSFNGQLSAKIGQEFELTVAKDLELILTIGVSMDPVKPPPRPLAPRPYKHEAQKSTSSTASSGAGSTLSGHSPIKNMKNLLLRSPRKKQQARFHEKENEERQRRLQREEEEEERGRVQHERNLKEFYKRADIWRDITGPRGEYCRGYVFESHYEKDIYGQARSFAVPLYNEWDKASNGVPKPVCELQVTMMYVPKLYGSEKIPMSMYQCQKELEMAKSKRSKSCEGFLTQQGGDCGSMWRRRYFTLNGTELVGHHEATKKRRALIHLEKAVAVKDTLSDDLWCIYEDRSFQITFEDGEAISFYADTIEARDQWLKVLQDAIANSTGQHRSWTDLVFEARDAEAAVRS